jgi:hypothetical protein
MARSYSALYVAAAATTAIAGILHLMMGPSSLNFNVNQGILFIVGGIAQVFWIVPMIRRWGIPWYAIGIAGTIAFIAIWVITRLPGNPITGRAGPADNPIAIMIEVFQVAFIGFASAIIFLELGKKKKQEVEESTQINYGRRRLLIIVGIVIALILIGLFVLPMLMPSPMGGGPPGQAGPPPTGTGQFGGTQEQTPIQENATGTGSPI